MTNFDRFLDWYGWAMTGLTVIGICIGGPIALKDALDEREKNNRRRR